jgi:hypothetical protein
VDSKRPFTTSGVQTVYVVLHCLPLITDNQSRLKTAAVQVQMPKCKLSPKSCTSVLGLQRSYTT